MRCLPLPVAAPGRRWPGRILAAVIVSIPSGTLLVGVDAVLSLLPLPALVIANVAVMREGGAASRSALVRMAWTASWGMLVIIGASALAYGGVGFATPGLVVFGATVWFGAAVTFLLVWQAFRVAIARVLPIDPDNPVHALAVSLTVLISASQVGNQVSRDVLQQVAGGEQLQAIDLIAQDIPFVLGALVGVGFLIRRGGLATLVRLGVVRPTLWQVALGLACAGLFYLVSTGADIVASHLTPDLSQRVGAANEHLFGQLQNPAGIATIALAAGISEELLFRGALQPRLGLVWPAIVFALTHSQYGLSVSIVAIFVLAVGLGLLRKFANTTTTMICHIAYNAAVGIGITGALIGPSVALEVALVIVFAVALVVARRRRTAA
jgi:uncharacterized protein